MSKVLITIPCYLPGFRSGGPQQTVQNICDVFANSNDIYLVTKNVDFGDNEPYDIETDKWLKLFGINIMYVKPQDYGIKLFHRLYKEFDVILACGLFTTSTIQMMLVNSNKSKKLYVAPMGVFSKNALALKSTKKRVFLKVFSTIGIFKRLIWSFTSNEELSEGKAAVGDKNVKRYIIAEDLPRAVDFVENRNKLSTNEGVLNIVFLSRISPKKNLLYAIQIFNHKFDGKIRFDIYGIKEDKEYWEKCEKVIHGLPSCIDCRYCGPVKPEESVSVFSNHDIFLFPTKGENFGHVIYEALAGGCLPVISDTTPWKDFDEKSCGNVIKLDDIDRFRSVIQSYIDMSSEKLLKMKMNAIDYAERKYKKSVETSGYKEIFDAPATNMGGGTTQ